jgi:FkbM family methyltransferase
LKKINIIKDFLRRVCDSFDLVAGNKFYSQPGEDAVLAAYFKERKAKYGRLANFFGFNLYYRGTYVEIGSYSPKRISNTYYFYKKGWRGITVEPNPNAKKWFEFLRPKDIHVTGAISNEKGKLYYYSEGYSGINFISSSKLKKSGYIRTAVHLYTLVDIFKKLDDTNHIDLLSVDCEGHDLEVLKSNDWSIYRPKVVIAETNCIDSDICKFMQEQDYKIFAWTIGSILFERCEL